MSEEPLSLTELEAERQEDFSLGGEPTGHPLFNPINGEGREPGHFGQLCLAQHFGLTKFFDIVSLIHPQPLPLPACGSTGQLLWSNRRIFVNIKISRN